MGRIVKHINAYIICVLVLITTFLIIHRNYFVVVDADFFGYLPEGMDILALHPRNFQIPPFWPLVVAVCEKLLPLPYPGITGAALLNILQFACSAYLFWRIAKKYYGDHAIVLFALFITNIYVYLTHLRVVNNPAFTLLTLVIFWLEINKRPVAARLLAGISFFVRVEGMLLSVSFLVADIVYKRWKYIRYELLTIGTNVLYWVLVVGIHNIFTAEISFKATQIPDMHFFRRTFEVLPLGAPMPPHFLLWPGVLLWMCVGAFYFIKRGYTEYVIMTLYLTLYTVSHVLFPETEDRYSYPILWLVYLLSFWFIRVLQKKHRVIPLFFSAAVLGMFMLLRIPVIPQVSTNAFNKYYRAEVRYEADYLKQIFVRTSVYHLHPWILSYYTGNNALRFPFVFRYTSVYDAVCANKSLSQQHLVLIDSYSATTRDYFDTNLVGAGRFQSFASQQSFAPLCTTLATTIIKKYGWVKVYSVDPACACRQKDSHIGK